MVEPGEERIAAATRAAGEVGALMTGRNEFGTIEVGKRADLILLARNPLEDVANLCDPVGAMAAGHNLHNEYVYAESDLNRAGYELLSAGRVEDALRLLHLNTEEYPESWNVHAGPEGVQSWE